MAANKSLLTRRGLLGVGAATAASACATAEGVRAATPPVEFRHGIASGDPGADRVVLWTRVTPVAAETGAVSGRWEIAEDREFAKPAQSGVFETSSARDFTVKIEASGLKAGSDYFYRFTVGNAVSPIGRTRTLTVGATEDLVLIAVSCQLYPAGYFNAYAAIAALDRVDAVLHLGDYIYEMGGAPDDYGMQAGLKLGRLPDPPHEIITLEDYRRRHALYKTDPDLQAAHARAPFIVVWDDHESANDCWATGAENHNPERGEGDWATRKAAAMRAYYEWMPLRDPVAGAPFEAINRSFEFGDLATLAMVETRLLARSQQVTFDQLAKTNDIKAFTAAIAAPDRTMMGPAQMSWLKERLSGSRAAGKPWQLLGNQVVMARVIGPDVEAKLGAEKLAAVLKTLPDGTREQVAAAVQLFKLGMPLSLDSWDGYPVERERLYAAIRETKTAPIVLSGDSHAFWANDLKDAAGRRVAAEFGASSITSPSWGEATPGFDLGAAIAERNEEVLFCDQLLKGYVRLTLRRNEAIGELIAVETILERNPATRVLNRWRVAPANADGDAAALQKL